MARPCGTNLQLTAETCEFVQEKDGGRVGWRGWRGREGGREGASGTVGHQLGVTSSNVELRNYVISRHNSNVDLRNYVISRQNCIK